MDRVIWCPSRLGNYTTASAWDFFRQSKNKVAWHSLVWFLERHPRAAFILWLAVQEKLGTQDRLYNPAPGILCLLCGACLETHNHLFFECLATKQIWERVLIKADISVPDSPWKERVGWMSLKWKGKTLSHNISKLCLSISVYQIWKERNLRFHTNSMRSTDDIYCCILEQVRLKLSTFRCMEDNLTNRATQSIWNLPDSIFEG